MSVALDLEYHSAFSKRHYDTNLVHSLFRHGSTACPHEHYPDICTGAKISPNQINHYSLNGSYMLTRSDDQYLELEKPHRRTLDQGPYGFVFFRHDDVLRALLGNT